jgi:SPP1 gp7 family putative phage head morphogenesis protein
MQHVRRLSPNILTDPAALENAITQLSADLETKVGDDWVRKQALRVAGQQDRGHGKQFFKGLEKSGQVQIEGTDNLLQRQPFARVPSARLKRARKPVLVPRPNAGVQLAIDDFAAGNVKFVGNVRNGLADSIRQQLINAAAEAQATGEDPKKVLNRLRAQWREKGAPSRIPTRSAKGVEMTVSSSNHAAMIARDQVATLNLEITKSRQTAAGIDEFSWQTQKDGKVRPEHEALQSTVHEWVTGADGVLPGEPINCRCWAQAVVDPKKVRESDGFVRVERLQV